jgi:hypothetical protein
MAPKRRRLFAAFSRGVSGSEAFRESGGEKDIA